MSRPALRGGRRRRRAAVVAALGWALACAAPIETPSTLPPPPAERRGYFAFRARHPDLLEPNYLPFASHRIPASGGEPAAGDVLVFCRWDDAAMPIAVAVEPPRIPAALADEFDPKPPEAYARAVDEALSTWERELGGAVRFRRVARDETLRIRLVGEVAPQPVPEVAVLGTTALGRACRIGAPIEADPANGSPRRLDVRFGVSEVALYVADPFGLLTPDQVRRNALHEIGHALGLRGHSPVPADLMFEVARDRPGADAPTAEDVNTLASLYRIPNGTVYGFAGAEPAAAATPLGPPAGLPRLDLAPHVDARFGFALRAPEGWMRAETPQGMFAIDGVTWDYEASLQLIVRGYDTPAAYLARHGDMHVGQGVVREWRALRIAGRPAVRLVVEGRLADLAEVITVVQMDRGRVLVVIADCPQPLLSAYRPWFEASLASLRIEGSGEGVAR